MLQDHRLVLTAVLAGQPITRTLTAADPFTVRDTALGPERTTAIELGPLHVIVAVRDQRPAAGVRLDVTTELPFTDSPDAVTYDFAVYVDPLGSREPGTFQGPYPVGRTVIDAKGVIHGKGQRKRALAWIGTPGRNWAPFDRIKWQDQGLLPNYQRDLVVHPDAVSNFLKKWSGDPARNHPPTPKDPWKGDLGLWFADEGSTGIRDEIGPIPAWWVTALLSQDLALIQMCLDNESLYQFPICFRDRATGRPLTIVDHPDLVLAEPPTPAGMVKRNFDVAHSPLVGYVPYLLTGDLFSAEQLAFLANWILLCRNAEYRGYEKGLVIEHNQTRGTAWALRTLACAALVLPEQIE